MGWVSLFSGGKDSAYALYHAQLSDRDVDSLLTVHTQGDSYMYHVPTTDLTQLAAESIGLPLLDLDVGDLGADIVRDAGAQGDSEIEPLEAALADRPNLTGIVAGAVESSFQTSRLQSMCDRLGIELYAPLWQQEPETLVTGMLDAGFEIMIVQVAAGGLDQSWLGRTLDSDALDDLRELRTSHGVHLLGEGGEYETLVTDGPHMNRRLHVDYDSVWEGTRGHIVVNSATLE